MLLIAGMLGLKWAIVSLLGNLLIMIGQFYKSVKFLVFFISPLLLKASVKNFSLYLFLCCQFTLISPKCCYFLPIPRDKILHLFQIFAPDSLTQPNTVRLKDFRKYYLQYLKIQVNMILKLMQKMCFDCNLVYTLHHKLQL